ncbi:hypothetical protein PV325_009538 [Microctonus aethiopoides]|nr:hypothetical protein PV325_009538 [Microctonus aethiopoides]
MESGLLTKVIHDFLTTVDGELCLSKGEYFLIHNVIDKHWCYGESYEKKGKFPTNYLHKIDIPNMKDSEKLFISIAAFRGEQNGDLIFGKGEFIIGVKDVEPGWCSGYVDSRTGVFPLSHVWLLDPSIVKKPTDKKLVKKKAKVNTSLKAQLDEELDLTEGEIVTVLEIVDDGWVLGVTTDGRTGTFPEGFISYIEDDCTDEIDEALGINMNSFPSSVANGGKIYKDFGGPVESNYIEEEPAPSYYDLFPDVAKPPCEIRINDCPLTNNDCDNLNPLGVNPYAITLYPFNAQYDNELNFNAGEVVHLIKHIDSEWAEGEIDGKKGIFPTSYVNIIVNCSDSDVEQIEKNNQALTNDEQLHVGELARVEYTFDAQMNGDLSVTEGDIVTVVEMPNDDWVCVRNKCNEVGLCPRDYLSRENQLNNEEPSECDPIDDDYVTIRNREKSPSVSEEERPKRLSEPHRPAPPAPAPGSVPLQKQSAADIHKENHSIKSNNQTDELNENEISKQKRSDKRQNVISELVITEKEYVRDLKVTYETFNLYNPSALEVRGIDVTILFGNILEIIHIAEKLLDSILRAMKGCDENKQMISPCFLKMADELQTVYGKYCGNHEAALSLLNKYEENKEIMTIFDKGIETLRHQVACFDMSSILIKPVQRILKYPLMLYELTKCTEDNHPDKVGIEEAWKVMTAVASYINEYKRRKDIVSKYLDSENTMRRKMSKLNMHSVAKKSSRLSAKLSATLGITNIPPDPQFDELERQFKSLEKCISQLSENVEHCITHLNNEATSGELLSDYLNQYHYGISVQEVKKYNETRVLISAEYMKILKVTIDQRVTQPINSLITLLEGPAKLITKRYDKLLDYDNAISKSEKYKDNRVIQEELAAAKNNYEALHQQLIEELPVLIDAATNITANCIAAFANARKLFYGKIMKRYLNLSESATQVTPEDIHQSFLVNHNLLWNQISRFNFAGVNPNVAEPTIDILPQSDEQRIILISKNSPDKLFIARENVISTSSLDLGITKGTVVAVIKRQDPAGDSSRWFVDNGTTKGFVPSNILDPFCQQFRGSTQNNNDVVDSRTSTPDLMCLDSPVKEIKSNLISLDSPLRESIESTFGNSQSSLYSNIDNTQNYETLSINSEKRHQNIGEIKFYYAQYDFDAEISGTLLIKKGQALKLIRPYDEKKNTSWWLMEDRDGNRGYVPSNYLNLTD